MAAPDSSSNIQLTVYSIRHNNSTLKYIIHEKSPHKMPITQEEVDNAYDPEFVGNCKKSLDRIER